MSKLTDEQLVDELFKLNESFAHENPDKFLKLYPRPMKHILDAMFRQFYEMKQERDRMKGAFLYMVDCHAANCEGATPNRLSKYDKQRFLSILEQAVAFIEGAHPRHYPCVTDRAEDVKERCERAIETMKEKTQ